MIRMWWYTDKWGKNFGDEIGPYLVQKLSGDTIKYQQITKWPFNKTLVTVGSILAASTRNCKVWGSGVIDQQHDIGGGAFYAVRGPITQRRLKECGRKVPETVGDPALLMPLVYKAKRNVRYKLGIIPHHMNYDEIREFVGDPEVLIIHLADDIEKIIDQINQCGYILSTSLHGLIVPHAYGVPAIWFEASRKLRGDGSKFSDYFLSVGIEPYKPVEINLRNLEIEQALVIFEQFRDRMLPNYDLGHIRNGLLRAAPFKVKSQFIEQLS